MTLSELEGHLAIAHLSECNNMHNWAYINYSAITD